MALNIKTICEIIGIPDFYRKDLLEIALTHPSYTNEHQYLTRQQQRQQATEYKRLALLGGQEGIRVKSDMM